MVDGWTGSVSDLTSIIEKIEKDETIKKFIFFAKSRYEKSFDDIKKNNKAFIQLENDVIQASTEFDYYTYFHGANCLCFFNGPEKIKSLLNINLETYQSLGMIQLETVVMIKKLLAKTLLFRIIN